MIFPPKFGIFGSVIKDFVTAYVYFKCWQRIPHLCWDSIICQILREKSTKPHFLKIFEFFWWNVHVVYLSVCITGELLVNNMIWVSKQLSPFTFLISWILQTSGKFSLQKWSRLYLYIITHLWSSDLVGCLKKLSYLFPFYISDLLQ